MTSIVFVQNQVSQLDEPVYSRMHELRRDVCAVVYWNDYGFERVSEDPEINMVPDLQQVEYINYPRYWLDRRKTSESEILRKIKTLDPEIVFLSDQPQMTRLRLAIALRRQGRRVVLRTDKNFLSPRPRRGLSLFVERQITRLLFDVLAPVSKLTEDYYGWPETKPLVLFPYTTNEAKFSPDPAHRLEIRQRVRERLGISPNAFVFISATKFSKRENPWELLKSFEVVAEKSGKVHLIALGGGPLMDSMKEYILKRAEKTVTFTGFVSFRQMQDYLFAADALVHLVSGGAWEVSPQDALFAGLGIITSDNVGSAQVHLQGEARRFLVPFRERDKLISRMLELISHGEMAGFFSKSAEKCAEFSVEATARRLLKVTLM